MGHNATLAVGYGESTLTPPLGVELCGYGFYLQRRALSVLDDLKARALYVMQGTSAALLVSCDLIGLGVAHTDVIRASLAQRLGFPAAHILIACTHTHTGPATVPLRGVGEMDAAYMATLADRITQAAVAAQADTRAAALTYAFPYVEPIGYNRRLRLYEPIDPVLKVALLERATDSVALTGYACHAVTLGTGSAVSADWPGGVVRAFERRGYRALVFQGFCGDIDPVVFLNGWGSGTPADLEFAGELLCQRALQAIAPAEREIDPKLAVAEERIDLPLDVPATRGAIDEELATFLSSGPSAGAERMMREWHREAHARYDALRASPWLTGVPIQGFALGGLRLLGVSGEVFCEYGTALRAGWPNLFTVGYAGGCVDYLPTAEAYDRAGDYAAYAAPRFYRVFRFKRQVQEIVLAACERVLHRLDRAELERAGDSLVENGG